MDTRVTDNRISRDFRRQQLAMRLVAHQARTQTICDLTGLTRHRLATLRRRWMISPETRRRGPSPQSFEVFVRSPRTRSEAASLAVFCYVLGAVPSQRTASVGKKFTSLESGERLCDAYEACRACLPQCDLEFEQLVLLATGLVQGDAISLRTCTKCEGTILIDRLGTRRQTCSQCHRSAGNASPSELAPDKGADSNDQEGEKAEAVQTSLF